MKQGRQNQKNHSLGPVKRDVPETFFRLCHHCLFLNESESEIHHCLQCEKDFMPSEGDSWEEESDRDLDDDLDEGESETPIIRKKSYLNGLNGKW